MSGYSTVGAAVIGQAMFFSKIAYSAVGQVRKYTGEPYTVHTTAVADIIKSLPAHTWEMVAVAHLHDVVEDTKITLAMIEDVFGPKIREGVELLTNVELDAGNRAERFKINLMRLAKAPRWVQTIKVADLIDNTSTIVQHDPKFASVYLSEKKLLLGALNSADEELWHRAWTTCVNSLETLERKS